MAEKAAGAEVRRFAARQAEERLGRLTAEISHVVQSHDADAVHDLRTSIRRLAQTLDMFEPFFRNGHPLRIRRKLKRIMVLAGEVRNCDVALKLLTESGKAGGADAAARLRSRRRECLHELIAVLKNWQMKNSPARWNAELEVAAKSVSSSHKGLNRVAPGLLTPLAKDFFKLGKRAARAKAAPEELHRFRIAGKKFRYSLELFIPLYGTPLTPLLEKIVRSQDILGDINDCETVRKLVSDYKGTGAFRKWLGKRQRRKTAKFRKYWRGVFEAEAGKQDWRGLLR